MSALLELHKVRKSIEDAQQQARQLFSDVSAVLEAGQSVALVGASGQGKSTLLRCVSWLDKADEGEVRLEGVRQEATDPCNWRMKVCYVAQQSIMLPGTVEQNLKTVSMLHKTSYDQALVQRLMSSLGLEHLELSKQAEDLSGGEKQRISLIRSLLLRPKVLLLDEITASLDTNSKLLVEELLREWCKREGIAQIWISHDLEQIRRVSNRVWFMCDGTLLEQCDAETFCTEPATREAREFVGVTSSSSSLRTASSASMSSSPSPSSSSSLAEVKG